MAAAALALRVATSLSLVLVAACGRPVPDDADVTVVLFGDSTCITDYLPEEQRVHTLLQARLDEHYAGQKIAVRNVCESGDTIRHFLDPRRYLRGLVTLRSRYERDVKDAIGHIDVALIRYGQNDMKQVTVEQFRAHVEELCDRLEADYPGIHLVLETNTYMDPEHGGRAEDNVRNNLYWQVKRDVARERGYPLVDHYERRKAEIAKGNWDFYIRSVILSKRYYGHLIVDGSKDEEMANEAIWLGNRHPNPNAVVLTADEELKVLAATWPDRLPSAPR